MNQLYFLSEPIELHQRFNDTFTFDELKEILDRASVISDYSILISTKKYFFELSADIGNSLDIFCYDNENHSEKKLTKEEFIKLYQISLVQTMDCIILDD